MLFLIYTISVSLLKNEEIKKPQYYALWQGIKWEFRKLGESNDKVKPKYPESYRSQFKCHYALDRDGLQALLQTSQWLSGQAIDELLIKVALEVGNFAMKQKVLLIWHNVDY